MTATYDPSTNQGIVRLLISDVNMVTPIFSDVEIQAFLDLEGGNVRLGAAQALESIASNEVQVLKVIEILDIRSDGTKVSAELRLRAQELRRQVDASGLFDWAEVTVTDFAYRNKVHNELLRGM